MDDHHARHQRVDPKQHTAAKEEIPLYKAKLRPFIRDADLYHFLRGRMECLGRRRVLRYEARQGVVYAFRGSTNDEGKHTFKLQGLVPEKKYRLRFHDHSASDRALSRRELLGSGLTVNLSVPNSSELIFIDGAGSV